ncbi:glycosyltransferase [Ferruginibacter sp.]
MTKHDRTLVILSPGFPHSETDTNCLPLQQSLVKKIKENYPQWNIVVLSFQYPYYTKEYQWYGITVMSFNGRNKGGLAKLLLRQRIYKTLSAIGQQQKITGILSFWYGECALVAKRFADKNNIPQYCWILGQDAKKENSYPGRTQPLPGELIALSDFIQDEFEKNHSVRPAHVIPAGIEPSQFNAVTAAKDIDIIAAGSLLPLKRYEILIAVIAAIKKNRPAVTAVLIGDGPEKDKLQQMITAAGLESNILLTGQLPHPEVLQWMQRGKIFLHPSAYEGFGAVCIEALYAGCKVISFCKPMKAKINGWYIVSSTEAMQQKAIQLLQENTVYEPVSYLTMDMVAEKMMRLFE